MTQKRVAAIVLAAGRSSRMGAPKQLLEIEGRTMLRRAVETVLASRAELVIVVSRHFEEVADLPVVQAAFYREPDELSDSIKNGLSAIRDWEEENALMDAALFVPCDLPLLTSSHLDSLIEKYRGETQIVASRFAGTSGIPMLFGRALWAELDALEGDKGGRGIVARYPGLTASVDFEGALFDLDTPADLEAFGLRARKDECT